MGGHPSSLIAVAPSTVAKSVCLEKPDVDHDYKQLDSDRKEHVARDIPVFESLAHSLRKRLIVV
jgi:hypothetical protein